MPPNLHDDFVALYPEAQQVDEMAIAAGEAKVLVTPADAHFLAWTLVRILAGAHFRRNLRNLRLEADVGLYVRILPPPDGRFTDIILTLPRPARSTA
jgi:hypothetical protein